MEVNKDFSDFTGLTATCPHGSSLANTIDASDPALSVPLLRWAIDSEDETVKLVFDGDLTAPDQTQLDSIIAAHTGEVVCFSDRVSILNDILGSVADAAQQDRLLDALDKYGGTVIAALDNQNWTLSRARLDKALTAGHITQADYDLCDSKIPT